jgi:Flp pilus assembly pilin Flp
MSKKLITVSKEEGQTMAEYAVVLAVITAAVVTSFSLLSEALEAGLNGTVDLLSSVV